MKDGLRFVDSDMHIMEPPDLFERYLDPKFKHRVRGPIGGDGRPKRGTSAQTIIDGAARHRRRRHAAVPQARPGRRDAEHASRCPARGWPTPAGWTSPSSAATTPRRR